ncbi:hypothetical protein Acr_00g0020490 [Actinidia rufa]|uniref:Uncharacterized protein n=1 Tax=Actinidia rufa TaxID=165716 RepID=A0A7J0DC10_9ERIC|nr:hypothetical protein Acr_00g0020490 [Actinidia rufa]
MPQSHHCRPSHSLFPSTILPTIPRCGLSLAVVSDFGSFQAMVVLVSGGSGLVRGLVLRGRLVFSSGGFGTIMVSD